MIPSPPARTPWLLLVAALIAIYTATAASNLGDAFGVGGDEVLIMSASHKLAEAGVYGSDLATGLFGAERRFFINLPLLNLVQAVVFGLAGTGIWQARLPSVAAGIAVIVCATWFARRAFGWPAAGLTAVLLVFWRSNLIDTDPRPPLLALAPSGRYDLLVVAWLWATIALLQAVLEHPRKTTAFLVGVCAGLTALTQFYGIAALILTALVYVVRWRGRVWHEAAPRWSALGCVMTVAPYATFVLLNLDSLLLQAALQGPRLQFADPRFWLGNLLHEPSRYAEVTAPSTAAAGGWPLLGPWLVWAGVVPGLVPLMKGCRGRGVERALPMLSLVVPLAVLALADQTKAVLYTSLLVPAFCLSLACGLDAFARGGRVIGRIAVALLLIVVVAEGVRGYQFAWRESRRVSPYLDVGRQIAVFLPEDRPVLGSWRWWWALADRPYLAVGGLLMHASRVQPVTGSAPLLGEEVSRTNAGYLIIDRDFLADLDRTVPAYRQDAVRFIDRCSSVTGALEDGTYGRIEVRRISCP